jgi:hypothetical protein
VSGVLHAVALLLVRVEAHFDTTPHAVYGLMRVEIAERRLTVTDDLRADSIHALTSVINEPAVLSGTGTRYILPDLR